jgi:hypothetical protein
MTDRSNLTVQDRIKQFFKDPDDKTPQSNIIDKTASEVELLDKTQPIGSSSKIDKGKGVLTSPSLENLNNQAAES